MVVEWIAIGLGMATLFLVVFVARMVMKSPAVAVDRMGRELADGRNELRQLGLTVVGLDERTKILTSLPGMVSGMGQQMSAVTSAIPSITTVEERTRSMSDGVGRIPAIETKLHALDEVRSSLEDLSGRLRSERKFGKVGEEAVEAILCGLPEDTWRSQFPLAGGRVDFAFLLPNGKIIPIDSKTGGSQTVADIAEISGTLEELPQDDPNRKGPLDRLNTLRSTLNRTLIDEARESADYMKADERSLSVAVVTVPDPVYEMVTPKTRQACLDYGVEVIPYSLLLPFLQYLRRQNLYRDADVDNVVSSLGKVSQSLATVEETLDNSVDKAITMLGNASRRMRAELATSRGLLSSASPPADEGPSQGDSAQSGP